METSNSVLMFGKQRTGAMLPVVVKFFKDEDTYRHERLFYADHSNPQYFPGRRGGGSMEVGEKYEMYHES